MEGLDLLGALEGVSDPLPPNPIFPFFSAALLSLGFGLQRAPDAITALSLQSCSSEMDKDVAVPQTSTPPASPGP